MFDVSTVLVLLLLPGVPQAQASERTGCAVADDAAYAYTKEQPVQVGGSPMYGAARERRYLDALRGPRGERIQYKRRGSLQGPDGTFLDAYEVTYEGLDAPVTLYLDWYHYNPQMAPRGFICGQPIGLGVPPINPFQEGADREKLAVAQGATRDFDPIPLGSDGSTTHGVVYDRFRIVARAARAAAAGTPLDPAKLPQELPHTVIVAYPLACGERTVRPTAIDLVAPNGAVMPKTGQRQASGDEIAGLVARLEVPEGSLAIAVQLSAPRPNDTIRITYAEGCGTGSDQVNLRVTGAGPRGIEMPQPVLPEGAPAEQPVLLQVLVDLDGRMYNPTYVGGPTELAAAAIAAVASWQSEPGRINGAPVATGTHVQVRFKMPALSAAPWRR
jgi:hypothetical protein